MAEEEVAAEGEDKGGGGGDSDDAVECPKCEECIPGLPAWMGTFSDLVTLLLTFFVLLLSFAKTETAKYEAALGSIRDAFGGNVLKQGEVLQLGKSPDNRPTMLETPNPIRPFPIDFLTMEGLLDKHEMNRESAETLEDMRSTLYQNDLAESADIYEMPEGIKIRIKDKILFKTGSTEISEISIEVFQRVIKLMKKNNWTIFVQGHASVGERSADGGLDALQLSAQRSMEVTKALIERGVRPDKITTVFYGDTRPDKAYARSKSPAILNQRVDFILRKTDLYSEGHKVPSL